MADFVPPSGPPPPKVPEGWKALWNDQYKEWFYVNTYTKQSQWEKPTSPIYPPSTSASDAPPGPPPTYTGSGNTNPEKSSLGTNNPYSSSSIPASTSSHDVDADARYAAKLQEEENARMRAAGGMSPASRDAQQDYVNTPMPQGYEQALPPRPQEKGAKGFLSKLMGKSSGAQGGYGGQQAGYGQQGGAYFEGFGGEVDERGEVQVSEDEER
ncbi:WW domain [Lasallia pustulata]|uniref:WW domain n=1 Tax=Lasallia pustulata TaxID=136370 RepID=A0A1W5CY88_9LECA|nr:WW domain [Lasallia pustulata]